ncbi:MAG: DUF1178 family protein [Candidatus Pelagibacter bacterium]|nr:DUF1178 family protein [Candidatus Pelagibacter bacterium]MBL6861066.1 DUF1178 family protein [Candidatus Pelagibacter bacterium]
MIKYNLKCQKDHEFESWFSSSEEFEKLNKKKMLECIYCSSKKIKKSIMAPMISNLKSKKEKIVTIKEDLKNERNRLLQIRKYIEKNFEYVGKNFSKKVREIYYDKKNKKAIYGTATPQEREELADEGVDLLSVPWIEKDN